MVEKIKYIVNILIVVLLFATVAIVRDGRVVGEKVEELITTNDDNESDVPVEITLSDGTRVINSSQLAKDVVGFGGRTPVKLFVKDDVIQKIEIESNNETPSFMEVVLKSGLFERWNGLSLSKAALLDVEAVSGATYSSVAIATNVKRAAEYGANVVADKDNFFVNLSLKDILGTLVILSGVLLTFIKFKNRWIITVQYILNIAVLGFWCGSFLSLATITTWISSGVNLSISVVTFLLLCVVLIMPLLGKKGSYCHLHCPLGSAQELLGRVPFSKLKINPKIAKFLNNLRYYILLLLLFMMWLGVGFDLMNYELFSAFIFSSASNIVLIMAALFLLLSLFVHRPYCRFVCPTGALITISQKTK